MFETAVIQKKVSVNMAESNYNSDFLIKVYRSIHYNDGENYKNNFFSLILSASISEYGISYSEEHNKVYVWE